MMKVIVTDPTHSLLYERLSQAGMKYTDASSWSQDKVLNSLGEFEGIVTRSKISIDTSLIDQNPQLRFIARVGAGMEHIDVEYAKRKGISVFSSPEGNKQAVAEHALGMLLSLFNRIPQASAEVKRGQWLRKKNEGIELEGKTVGIIGFGNTGMAFARLLKGFQVRILVYDKYKEGFGGEGIEAVSMDEIFHSADIVSLHLPLTDETEGLTNEQWFGSFKKPIYLINTSRGPIVPSGDVLSALDSGLVLGACLDVADFENTNLNVPSFDTLPAEAKKLVAHERVIFTPHVAGFSRESFEKLSSFLCDKIVAHFKSA